MKGVQGGGAAARNNRANQLNPNNPAFTSSQASTMAAANNRSNQLNPNHAAFWSSRKGAVAGDAAGVFSPNAIMCESVRVHLANDSFINIPVPVFAVGYALHGEDEKGVVVTPEHPLVIIFVRKTPRHESCGTAFNDAQENYPTLKWHKSSAIANGGMTGEPPPYWCMRLIRNDAGEFELDPGCGFNSLDGVVDGLVRAPLPPAPCGLDAPRPHCPDCKKPMEAGTASGMTECRLDPAPRWQALDRRTPIERNDWNSKEPPLLPIRTYRCPTCGLLRDYAFGHDDWNTWDKKERRERESAA